MPQKCGISLFIKMVLIPFNWRVQRYLARNLVFIWNRQKQHFCHGNLEVRSNDYRNSSDLNSPILASRNFRPTPRQPKPYFTLRWKLMEEASLKYFVGQLTSPMVKPCQKICASIWLSNTKSSEFLDRSSFCKISFEKAR